MEAELNHLVKVRFGENSKFPFYKPNSTHIHNKPHIQGRYIFATILSFIAIVKIDKINSFNVKRTKNLIVFGENLVYLNLNQPYAGLHVYWKLSQTNVENKFKKMFSNKQQIVNNLYKRSLYK